VFGIEREQCPKASELYFTPATPRQYPRSESKRKLSQLTGRESVLGPLETQGSSGLTVARFLSSATLASALAGSMLTVWVSTSAIGQRNQLRSGLLQRGYWRGVAAVKYNSDALGHCSRSSPNAAGQAKNSEKPSQ
jgi:hypothetical protein